MKKRLLIQCQLSNYDSNHNFILECDSGWNMSMGRVRVMLDRTRDLTIHVMCPNEEQCITKPTDINQDLWEIHGTHPGGTGRLKYIHHDIIPNALASRYDFSFRDLGERLLGLHKFHPELRYDAVYINDPMHLRNFRAMFHITGGYTPRFYVHSHFIDNPECPKFPTEASLWLGQCEAAIRADHNFWQCKSSMQTFFESMRKEFTEGLVDLVIEKSTPWDDGYCEEEIRSSVDESNLRFNPARLQKIFDKKRVIFVPNRIGGKGRSSDYTNCGKFMFEMLPKIHELLGDTYVVIAGNPSQKFSNDELTEWCGKYGYLSVVPDSLRRDEFKWIAERSHVAVGLYDQDTYGGTAARECVELECFPLWLDNFEYKRIMNRVPGASEYLAPTLDDVPQTLKKILDMSYEDMSNFTYQLQHEVYEMCSYECTTRDALGIMQLND